MFKKTTKSNDPKKQSNLPPLCLPLLRHTAYYPQDNTPAEFPRGVVIVRPLR